MIELISPKNIFKEKEIIKELEDGGMNHLSIDSVLGWNYILDHVWLYKNAREYLVNDKLKNPTVLDVGCGNSPFHKFLENQLEINILGIDRPNGFCHQDITSDVDYSVDFLKLRKFKKNSVDIIYWLSAIEHNKKGDIAKLYDRSISLLRPGGLLLITFPISEKTSWFEDSQQTNLSIDDAKRCFREKEVSGSYESVRDEYTKNILNLRDKYRKRYNHFDEQDPRFIVGGLKQRKSSPRFLKFWK